ncbi:hypothetical protein C469_02930 [Halorubrum lipolyticum DSM 21995]|uniref:Uncharacterized protein n=1 Tax=Halorubrum lipolyticum DSM 21995 TaxID=1227482 RepID=M0P0D2_9EURY|nr:hypothetical protein C469_02930 [Halorubrum lipolyticum DSM 21995]
MTKRSHWKCQAEIFHFWSQRDNLGFPPELLPPLLNAFFELIEALTLSADGDVHIRSCLRLPFVILNELFNAFTLGFCVRFEVVEFPLCLLSTSLGQLGSEIFDPLADVPVCCSP